MPDLRPALLRSRRRSRTGVAAIVAISVAGNAALIAIVAHRPEPVATVIAVPVAMPGAPAAPAVHVVAMPPRLVVSMIPTAGPARAPDDLGPCPARWTRSAGAPLGQLPHAPSDEPIRIAASWFDLRRLATWSSDRVYISIDEGASFQPVLAGGGAVLDATFDCHGRLHVLRTSADGHLTLGTFDDGSEQPERWTRVGGVYATTTATVRDPFDGARLVPAGGDVAILAPDPRRSVSLAITRRDRGARWRTTHLLDETTYGSWDGIEIEAFERHGRDRIRLLARPYQGGECGYSAYLDAVVNLETLRVSSVVLSEEEARPAWAAPAVDDLEQLQRDVAGRWLAIANDRSESPVLLRLSMREVAERARAETEP